MQNKTERKVRQYHRARHQRVRACAALTVLALVVSMGTGLALIKPAATMENTTYCGIEAHIHNEECFESVLICTEENREGHAHTDACWGYPCGLEEREGHTHNEECTSLGCGMTEAHVHTDCVDCTLAEAHTHDESCYEQTSTLICGLEESAEHAHGESCYETQTNLICGKAELPEHIHGEGCQTYVCGQAECEAHSHELCGEMVLICGLEEEEPYFTNHVHDPELCYEQKLICEKEEHEHVDACYVAPVTYCGLEEHFHDEFCIDENGLLVCGMENHVHVDECFVEPVDEAVQAVIEMIDQLPEPAELYATAELLCEDEEAYMAYAQEIANIAWPAYYAYEELTDEQKAQVTNFDKLMDGSWLWSIMTLEESAELTAPDSYVTAIWKDKKDEASGKNFELRLYCVDENGNNLLANYTGSAKNYNIDAVGNINGVPTETKTRTIYDLILEDLIGVEYVHSDTKITVKFSDGTEQVVSNVINLSYNDQESNRTSGLGWIYLAGESWSAWDNGDDNVNNQDQFVEAYLIFASPVRPEIIPNEINEDINITMFDYGSGINNVQNGLDFFDGGGTQFAGLTLIDGHVTADNGAGRAKVLKKMLVNNYPETTDGLSWEYLFNGTDDTVNYGKLRLGEGVSAGTLSTKTEDGKTIYAITPNSTNFTTKQYSVQKGDGGLFQFVNGYYTYNSGTNAAYYNGERFELYDALFAPGHTREKDPGTQSMADYWYNFLPFNQPYAYNKDAVKSYTAINGTEKDVYFTYYDGITQQTSGTYDANAVIPIVPRVGEVTNLWFGMKMDFDFMMPKNGLMDVNTDPSVEELEDMVFKFSGDDDVLVYVDDVLVLDIGGTHGKLDGTINFANGDVVYTRASTADEYATYKSSTVATTVKDTEKEIEVVYPAAGATARIKTNLRALYTAAYNENVSTLSATYPTLNDFLTAKGFDPASSSKTFVNYSEHSLDFFYMERGGNISFCSLEFNMPILPKNSLNVAKALEGNEAGYGDEIEYNFQVIDKDGNVTLKETGYTLYDNGVKAGTGTTDSNGLFTLKAGQLASFNGITVNQGNFAVRELLPVEAATCYGDIVVNGDFEHPLSADLNPDGSLIEYEIMIGGTAKRFRGYTTGVQNIDSVSALYFSFTNTLLSGNLQITKQIVRTDGATPDATAEFRFELKIPAAQAGEYTVTYEYDGSERADETLTFEVPSGEGADTTYAVAQLSLVHNETATIAGLPAGVRVTVTELNTDGYSVKWSNVETVTDEATQTTTETSVDTLAASVTSDMIEPNGTEVLRCTNTTGAVLPSTGGMGTTVFYIVGAVLMLGAVVFLVARKKMGKEE